MRPRTHLVGFTSPDTQRKLGVGFFVFGINSLVITTDTEHMGRERDRVIQKKWKRVHTRASKVARARQLGFEYPRRTSDELLSEHLDEHDD